jgi:hypothetical protein
MPEGQAGKKGVAIFIALLLLFVAIGIGAYLISGDKGIEERFSEALGLGGESEKEGGGGFFGFNIEGNVVIYAIILLALVTACAILLKVFKI